MVAGKTNPQALARTATCPKLPPLNKLRVRRPNQTEANPCLGAMSSVLGCWASQGFTTQGCALLEAQLRACMDARKSQPAAKNNINSTLARFYPQIIGPHKRRK